MRVLIVSGIWPPEVGGPASHGPGVRPLPGRPRPPRPRRHHRGPGRPGAGPGFPIRAARKDRPDSIRQPAAALTVLAAARGADVVYATGLYGRSALASALRRIPLVLKLVNDPAYERARRLGLVRRHARGVPGGSRAAASALLKRSRDLDARARRQDRHPEPLPGRDRDALGHAAGADPRGPQSGPGGRARLPSRAELRERLGFDGPDLRVRRPAHRRRRTCRSRSPR